MEAIEKFFASEAFFPVLVVLLSLLLLTLVWITLSNRRKQRNMIPQNSVIDENSTVRVIRDEENINTSTNLNNELPTYQMVDSEQENEIVEEITSESVIADAILPEMPEVPIVNEIPVELDFGNPVVINTDLVENDNISPEVETSQPIITDDEIVNIDISKTVVEEQPQENEIVNIDVPSPIDVTEENEAFAVTLDEVQSLTNDIPNIAFGALPTDDVSINDDVQVELPNSYEGNKTEVFDFPNFGDEINNLETDTARGLAASQSIESDVIEAANRYIRSVMSK